MLKFKKNQSIPSLSNKPLNFWLGGGIRGWLMIGGRRNIQEKE